jgi:excisionase family DNA binding protein
MAVGKLLTVKELSERTGVPVWRWYEMFNERSGPPFVKFGNTYRVREEKLEGWLEAEETKVEP